RAPAAGLFVARGKFARPGAELFEAAFETVRLVQWPPRDVPLPTFPKTSRAPGRMFHRRFQSCFISQRLAMENGRVHQVFVIVETHEHGAVVWRKVRRGQHRGDSPRGVEPESRQQRVQTARSRPAGATGAELQPGGKEFLRIAAGKRSRASRPHVNQLADIVERHLRAPRRVNIAQAVEGWFRRAVEAKLRQHLFDELRRQGGILRGFGSGVRVHLDLSRFMRRKRTNIITWLATIIGTKNVGSRLSGRRRSALIVCGSASASRAAVMMTKRMSAKPKMFH